MKAIVQERYGSPDVLKLMDVEKPVVGDDGVLVRVRAASVNVLDWRRMRGTPFVVRIDEGLRTPKNALLGRDAAGHVEEVGKNVRHLQPGDEVFGVGDGAFAEYVVGRTFAPKPKNLSFEEAAAVPIAGWTALQGLRDKGGIESGQKILVNGAGGGVGTFVVQIAKALGGEVTAVTKTASVGLVRSIGADDVIDHTREDFRDRSDRYDLIVEVGQRLRFPQCRRSLSPQGRLVLIGAGGGVGGPIGRFIAASFRLKVLRQPVVAFVSWESTDDLLVIKDFIEAGKVRPVIDRTYGLDEAPQAVRHVEEGHPRGKIVITV
jgi:NADPH:quinone reductase-like Zn-dependent oxidoreductase